MTGAGPDPSGSGVFFRAALAVTGQGGAASTVQRLVLLVAVAMLALTALALWTVQDRLASAPTLCPVRALTGLYCPGCGSTRAAAAFLHGDLTAALGFNPLAALAAPLVAYASLKQAARMISGRALPRRHVPARYIWALLVLVLAYALVRNLPWFPFTLLAP